MGDLGNKHPAPPPVRGFPVVREWKPKVDPKTGRNFYFNPLTKASAWTLPELEQPKVHCFKCFKELDSAAAQCCAPEPEPSGDDSSRGRSSTKTAPTKPAPRRNTGAGIATFVQPASPPPPDESCIPPSPSESITSSPTPLPSESSSPSTNSIPTNNPSLSESSIPSTRSSLTDSSSPPTDSSSPSVSPTISVEASSPDSEYKAGEREQVADSGLPLGWIAILDKSVGSLYYFHSETQEVTWTRPESQRAVVEADLPYGWVAIKDSSSQSVYYFNQHTQEVTWEKPDMPLPLQDDPVPESASDRPKIRPGALLAAKNALLETKSRDSYNLQGLSEADTTFLNDVLRPKYGDGQLLKDPSLVDSLFALMTTRESLRKVIFCEFFLSCFRQDVILQAMLRRASWKCWLVSLISEAGVGTEMVDYVLMTLIEMFSYFFHRFSENENTILGTDIVLGIGVSFGKHITMYDFVMDAAFVLVRASSKEVCLRMFSGTFSKIASWGPLKPPWAVPNFLMPQWQNLFSSIEAVEECIFFTIPSKEFCLPERPVFPGMSAVDAIIALLERLKVKEFDQIVETDPAILKLQKAYSIKGVQELEFFRGVRDFFQFYSTLGCMEKHRSGFEIKSKPPPRCSQAEFVQLLLARKRVAYGTKSQLQRKVAAFVHHVGELYSKVFAGELQAPHLAATGRKKSPSRTSGSGEGSPQGFPLMRRSSLQSRHSMTSKPLFARLSTDQPRLSASGS